MAYNEERLTKLKHLKLLAARINSDFASKASVAGLTQKMDEAAAVSGNIANSMYQAPTATQYTTAIEPFTSGTGPVTGCTVGALLGDEKLAGLTSSGTDDEGNNKYDLIINDVTIGAYTKNTVLSDIMSDINGNEQAAVGISYSEAEEVFTFTAKNAGAEFGIKFDSGLAEALFDSAEAKDWSTVSFVSFYGMSWLKDGVSTELTFSIPGHSSYSFEITNSDSLEAVANQLNGSVPMGDDYAFACNKYTGQIEAKNKASGELTEFSIKNKLGNPVSFDKTKAPADPFTRGKDGVFTAIKVNGEDQSIINKAVNISVPTKVSQLNNDSQFQTATDVAAAVAALDLSGYVQKEDGKGLSANDYTDEDKAKLAGIEIATNEEVTEMLAEIFGAAE